jgi:ribose-phosphate pyrophosphokinase
MSFFAKRIILCCFRCKATDEREVGNMGVPEGAGIPPRPAMVFALSASAIAGGELAEALGCRLALHEERSFEDGEHKIRPLEEVSGADVFVLQSLHAGPADSANDKLCRLLFFIGALKDAGAARVTALVPYLCYARKDRRTKTRDPVTTRYLAALFEAVGTDTIVTLDVHNPVAFENAFRCRTIALTAAPLFLQHVKSLNDNRLSVVSPDTGGAKRAELFREALEGACGFPIARGFVEKRRSAGIVSGDIFAGDADDMTVLLIDDLISTGHTLLRAAKTVRKAGARRVIALVTHGLFMPGSSALLTESLIDSVVVTDSVPPFRLSTAGHSEKITILRSAGLMAESVRRLHENRGFDDLLVY